MKQLSWLDDFEMEARRNASRDPFAHDAVTLVEAYRNSVLNCDYWLTVKSVLDSRSVKLDTPQTGETVDQWIVRKRAELETSNAELCGGPSGPSERAPGSAAGGSEKG